MSEFFRHVTLVGFVALAALTSGGCEYILGYPPAVPLDPGASFDPGAPFGTPEATYRTGTATVVMGDQIISLGRLASQGVLTPGYGADVVWAGEDGWYLRVSGAQPTGGYPYITIDRVADGRHMTSYDATGCQVKVARADKTGVEGTASCKTLTWVDAISSPMMGGPLPSEGPSFTAEITFEAAP